MSADRSKLAPRPAATERRGIALLLEENFLSSDTGRSNCMQALQALDATIRRDTTPEQYAALTPAHYTFIPCHRPTEKLLSVTVLVDVPIVQPRAAL